MVAAKILFENKLRWNIRFSPNFMMVHFSCLSCCTSGWSDSISVPRLQKIKKINLTDLIIRIMNHEFSNTKKS